ncbi:hypothetical protein B2I21_07525 [Chryseobacterium mucoviscidosis]|nr:hypothetical protein B2I21_07525 [Chryseobacterium mucoviscidosis]
MYRVWVDTNEAGEEVVRRIEQLEANGLDYESIPDKPQPTRNRTEFQLLRNPESKELYWKEVDRPATQEELLEDLKRENVQLAEESNANQLALMELHMMLLGVNPDAG